MKCEQARIEMMDGRRTEHLQSCDDCRAFVSDYEKISGLLHSTAPAPRELRERLVALTPRPRKILRFALASAVAAAAAFVIALPLLRPPEPAPKKPVDTAQFDAELDLIKKEIERIDLDARLTKLESR